MIHDDNLFFCGGESRDDSVLNVELMCLEKTPRKKTELHNKKQEKLL